MTRARTAHLAALALCALAASWTTPASAAPTQEQRCQAGKNDAAGVLALCLQRAEERFVLGGDSARYADAVAKCDAKFAARWESLEERAADAGSICPDAPLAEPDLQTFIHQCSDAVADALDGGGLPPYGDASAAEVLAGRSFTNQHTIGLTGTMPNRGAITLTPSTADQAITAGYHDGGGKCVGDSDLTAGNIRSGVSLFGVAGTALTASGNALAGEVLAGRTFSNDSGAATGAMIDRGAITLTPSTADQAIAAGYHDGGGKCVGDTDLTATNIKKGVDLFGVAGTVQPPPLVTSQSTSYGAGSDGDLRKGATRSFTDNGNGTITDNTTGLMWEKKEDFDNSAVDCISAAVCPNPHDADNRYSWTASPPSFDGRVVSVFLTQLNTAPCFAGHCDWRLPNINELLSLVDYDAGGPATFVSFHNGGGCTSACSLETPSCSCTTPSSYWSSTTSHGAITSAWDVYFDDGQAGVFDKANAAYARAVRGGH